MQLISQEPSWNQAHRIGQIRRELAARVHNPHYTVWAQRITPAVSVGRLMMAWRQVNEAHHILSSRFDIDYGRWLMPSAAPDEFPIYEVIAQDFRAALTKPFVHPAEPVSRLVLARHGDSSLIGIAADHLISDGWSLAQLSEELVRAYNGEPLTAEHRFTEYVREQNEFLRAPGTLARADRVVDKLTAIGGVLPPLHIGTSTKAVRDPASIAYHDREFTLVESQWKAVRSAAPVFGISPSNLILAALHAALARVGSSPYAGSTMTLANRRRPADRKAVGSYAAKMALTIDAQRAGADDIGYLDTWRSSFWSALDTSDIPWAYLLYRLHPDDFGNFTQRRYATFNFQPLQMNAQTQLPWSDQHVAGPVGVPTGRRDQSLATFWVERPTCISCLWEYRIDALDHDAVTALWNSFSGFVDEFCAAASPVPPEMPPASA